MTNGARTSQLLRGCRVLVTRPAEQAAALADALRAAGAVPALYPTVVVTEPPDWAPFDLAFGGADPRDWTVFTSPSAVRLAAARLRRTGDFERLRSTTIAAVGPGTAAALAGEGLATAVVPGSGARNQEGLAAALAGLPAGTRVIFPRALEGREVLAGQLRGRGVTVETVPVSQTRPAALGPLPAFDAAVFASPSAFRALVQRWTVGAVQARILIAIGPVTAQAIAELGASPSATALDPTAEAVVAALATVWRPGLVDQGAG